MGVRLLTRNGENRKARIERYRQSKSRFKENGVALRSKGQSVVCDEAFNHSDVDVEGAFWVSYCKDHQYPATAFAKFGHTVITNELAHGVNCWSLSRYLYDLIPSTSQVNLKGRAGSGMSLRSIKNELGLPFEFTRLARSSGHIPQLEHSLEDPDDNLGHQLCTQGPGQNITADVLFLGTRVIDLRRLRKRALLKRQ